MWKILNKLFKWDYVRVDNEGCHYTCVTKLIARKGLAGYLYGGEFYTLTPQQPEGTSLCSYPLTFKLPTKEDA